MYFNRLWWCAYLLLKLDVVMRNIIFLIIVFLLGCSNADSEVILMPGIKSYSTFEEIKKNVKVPDENWKIVEDTRTPFEDKRPAYRLFVNSLKEYSNLGKVGEVKFFYFNNRLMKITFYPVNPEQYIATLNKEYSLNFDIKGYEESVGSLIIRVSREYTNRIAISFVDKKLEKEHDDWIRKYS